MNDTLRLGDRGAAVATLQQRLAGAGFPVTRDHVYGPRTEAAVRAFQHARDQVADGIVGPRTWRALRAASTQAGALTQTDVAAAAAALDCDVAAIQAIVEVESGASGYLADGRVDILFERHIMYRQLKAASIDPAPYVETLPGIVNPKRGGYQGGAAEYARLARAQQIDVACAIESTSWGRFQIMGFHWSALGYASAVDFAAAMQASEKNQLDAFVRLLQLSDDGPAALRNHDWAAFARLYNGPAYAAHDYDGKLARAYARHAAAAVDVLGATVDALAAGKDASAPRARRRRKSTAAAAGEASP